MLGHVAHAAAHFVLGQAELERPERELVLDARAEQLHVGVLEDEADPGAEVAAERRVLERLLRERSTEGEQLTRRREDEAVQHLEQRGLAGAVGADDGDVLTRFHREVDPGERRPAGAIRVADRAQDVVGRRHSPAVLSAASATAHSATLAASHSQSPGPTRSRRSDGIAPV